MNEPLTKEKLSYIAWSDGEFISTDVRSAVSGLKKEIQNLLVSKQEDAIFGGLVDKWFPVFKDEVQR